MTESATGRSARHEATKRRILDSAWGLSAERGLTGWTLTDVGSRVGMRAPSLYVYVSSKNDLYDALFSDGYAQFSELVAGVRRPRDPAAMLRLAARTFVDFAVANPARYALLFQRAVPGFEPSAASYAHALALLDETRAMLAAAGATRQSDLDLWTALTTGLASQQLSNDPGGRRWRRLTDDAVEMFLAARTR
jgi:AcrR family transcriptional regulator